jgi:hypothetical protein
MLQQNNSQIEDKLEKTFVINTQDETIYTLPTAISLQHEVVFLIIMLFPVDINIMLFNFL